jgi:hypothetical protein
MRISEGPLSPASMVSHMHAARSRQSLGDIAKASSIFILPATEDRHKEQAQSTERAGSLVRVDESGQAPAPGTVFVLGLRGLKS